MCTTITALMACAVSCASFASIAAASAPWRQSPGMKSTSMPQRAAICRHSVAKWPVSTISTMIARRQRIDDRRFPGAGARRGKDDDRAGGLEDLLAALEYRLGKLGEFGAAMVDDRHVHGAEHAIRHRARAGNLQKMASLMLGHDFLT